MKRILIVPLLCVLTFGCKEISNDLSAAASDLKTGLSDLVGELDTALNGTQGEPRGDGAADAQLRPATETAQTDQPVASQPAKLPEMFTGEVVRVRFTKGGGLRSGSFKLIVQGSDGRVVLFDLRGRGAENMDFVYNLHDNVSLPLDSEALKKKFSLNYARFMDVDIRLHQPITTQPAAKPIPVPEQVKPKPDKPPVEEKPKEFGTLFDEEPRS